jgi:hypothetical protein
MLTQEEIAQQFQLLATYRRTLAVYLRQQAAIGEAFSPPALVNGIWDARQNIRRIKAALRASGLSIPEAANDEELEPTLRLAWPQQPQPQQARPRRSVLVVALAAVLLGAGIAFGVLGNWLNGTAATAIAAPPAATASLLSTAPVAVMTSAVQEPTAAPGAPTSQQNTHTTFDYSFEDGTTEGWDGPQDNWRVVQDNGGWIYQGTAPDDRSISATPPYVSGISDWTDYAVEMRMRIVKTGVVGDDYFDAWLKMRYDNKASGCLGYDFYLDAHVGEYVLAPSDGRDCPWVEMQQRSSELELNQWYTIRAETIGTQLRLYRDGQMILETSDDRVKRGSFFITLGPGAVVQFDEIHVEKLTT